MEDVEVIREVLQLANEKGLEGAATAMDALVRLNTALLEFEEDLAAFKGELAHG